MHGIGPPVVRWRAVVCLVHGIGTAVVRGARVVCSCGVWSDLVQTSLQTKIDVKLRYITSNLL